LYHSLSGFCNSPVSKHSRVFEADIVRVHAKELPARGVERLLEVVCEGAQNRVPERVQVVDPLRPIGFKEEEVTAHVTLGVLVGVTRHGMERLVDVSEVVDKQSQVDGLRKTYVHRSHILDRPVNDSNRIDNALTHLVDGPFDIEWLQEPVFGLLEAFVEERSVNEVPVGNALKPGILDEVRIGGTLYKRVVLLRVHKLTQHV